MAVEATEAGTAGTAVGMVATAAGMADTAAGDIAATDMATAVVGAIAAAVTCVSAIIHTLMGTAPFTRPMPTPIILIHTAITAMATTIRPLILMGMPIRDTRTPAAMPITAIIAAIRPPARLSAVRREQSWAQQQPARSEEHTSELQ